MGVLNSVKNVSKLEAILNYECYYNTIDICKLFKLCMHTLHILFSNKNNNHHQVIMYNGPV